MTRRWSLVLSVVLAVTLLAGLTACEEDPGPEDPVVATPVVLTFGVYGEPAEIAAYRTMVEAYNDQAVSVEVELVSWPDADALMTDLDRGAAAPDVFLTARRDLAAVVESERNTPLFDLLEARNISTGDDYAQRAIEAFSADDDLQCMPYTVSPMVIYYNTDLIDFEAMRERGLPAPADELEGWSFEEFSAAASFATRRRGETRGVSVQPTLRSLAPFLYSGGGGLFDDGSDPTSLALTSGDNQGPLSTVLGLLRDPLVTLSQEQLEEASPQEWFERGRLGMIEGSRELTPELRRVEGLDFDVMPMPRLGDDATVGEISGLCITPGEHEQQAADFLVHAISDEGVEPLAASGYVVPANLAVARSDAFLQPDQLPAHAGVFNVSIESMVLLPLIDKSAELNAAVDPLLDQMLNAVAVDVEALTVQIDEASRAVLDPDYVPEPSESSS